jgi:hypothetical protein
MIRGGVKRVLTGLSVALLFAVVGAGYTNAESVDTISLTPTRAQRDVDPGERFTDTFTVINPGTVAYDVKVYAKPYYVKDASYTPTFTEENERSDAYRWVSLPTTTYHLEPGQKVSIPYEVVVSSGATSGGHYGAIFAETVGVAPEGQMAIINNKSVGLLLHFNVSGNRRTAGALEAIDVPWYQPSAPLKAIARISNTGETDFSARVTFVVTDIAGDVKYQTSGDYFILPDVAREIPVRWEKSPWFGLYKARIEVKMLDKTEVKETLVVIAPRWLLFVAGLVILLGVIDVVRRKRTTPKRKSH